MDVKIITCHNVYNYGASLQAYALQETIKTMGQSCEIVDYNPWYLYDRYQFWNIGNKKWEKNLFTKFVYYIGKFPDKLRLERRKHCFEKFNDGYFNMTKERYYTHEELQQCACDVLICGSDQIWNPLVENGNDGAFFGEYLKTKKVISYAASIGVDKIPEEKKVWFKSKLNGLAAVSVRERSVQNELQGLGIPDVKWCIDPVYLLDKRSWIEKLKLKLNTEKYMLIYMFEGDKQSEEIIRFAAEKMSLKIYSINSSRCSFADRNFHISGPKEFLELLMNATIILTNSFHGVAFSIIFRKQFWTLERKGLNRRIADMLDFAGLDNRVLTKANVKEINLQEKIDYVDAEKCISLRIKESKRYLKSCLEEVE